MPVYQYRLQAMNRKTLRAQPATLPGLPQGGQPLPQHLPPEDHIAELQTALLQWFAQNQRSLPWRVSYTPYEVWISEVMLQQTQMERRQ